MANQIQSPSSWDFVRASSLPVLPGRLPLIGHLPNLHFRALDMLKKGHADLGPAFWVDMGFGTWMLFCLGSSSYELYRNKVTTNSRGAYHIFGKGIGNSMISHDGAEHSHVRSAMQPILSHRNIAETATGDLMASIIDERLKKMVSLREFRILPETLELTLEIVLRVTGVNVANLLEWKKQYREYVLMAWPVPFDLPGFPRRRGEKGMQWLNQEILKMLKSERSGETDSHGSLLKALVHMRDENGKPLSDTELVDNIRVLYAAGHETTSSLLAWQLIVLAENPNHWRALREEVLENKFDNIPTSFDSLKKLKFANAFFREVLRFHSPSWYNPRKTTTDIIFEGVKIPENALLAISPAYLARSPDRFSNPDQFDVNRWLDKGDSSLGPIELSTFGGGPHFCIGYHLAWQEALQFLVGLVLHLEKDGLRPSLSPGSRPAPRYLPFGHPEPSTKIRFI